MALGDGILLQRQAGIWDTIAAGSLGQRLTPHGTGAILTWTTPGSAQSSPSDPSGTTSTVGLMMGLAGSITPATSGSILVMLSGDLANSTSGDGAKVQLRYGTGSAPANTAALTGTAVGGLVNMVAAAAAQRTPVSLQALITGLTPATAYWLDVGLAAVTGGTATLKNVSLTAVEL